MHRMYAKLFSRIAQSSLMEQDVETRYCFMMLLAIADIEGDIIGTDVAIARAINLPLERFKTSIEALMLPDADSNSQVLEGRRVVKSDNGRGYRIVNYKEYRAIKTAEEKRAYMRDYMRDRRKSQNDKSVTAVKKCKNVLSDVTHAEGESETEPETKVEGKPEETIQPPPPAEIPAEPPKYPDLETFCEYFSPKIPDLGFPVPIDNWLMEQHGYLASAVWPNKPPLNWKAMEGKLIANYRDRHAQLRAKTLPIGPNGKPQKPINDF